jgi:hypothetical protein
MGEATTAIVLHTEFRKTVCISPLDVDGSSGASPPITSPITVFVDSLAIIVGE